jgi:hypothetical protein
VAVGCWSLAEGGGWLVAVGSGLVGVAEAHAVRRSNEMSRMVLRRIRFLEGDP